MVSIDQRAFQEVVREGGSVRAREFVGVLERHHGGRPGILEETLAAYARALALRAEVSLEPDALFETIAEQLTDAETWVDSGHLYELGGRRISRYPTTWHDRLGGECDPTAYLRFFGEMAPSVLTKGPGDRRGLNEDTLIDVMAVVGKMDRESARAAIESARDDGRLVEDADQHPKAGVYLAND